MFGIEKRHCQKCNFFFMYDIMRWKSRHLPKAALNSIPSFSRTTMQSIVCSKALSVVLKRWYVDLRFSVSRKKPWPDDVGSP